MRTQFPITLQGPEAARQARLARGRSILEGRASDRPDIPSERSELPTPPGHALALQPGVHEWFAPEDADQPPMGVLTGLAWRVIASESTPSSARVLWIGGACRPYPHALVRRDPDTGDDTRLLERSVFVDAQRREERIWAIDLAVRCAGVALVVADGSTLAMPESRRLQIAASSSRGVALLTRPARERCELSAAGTRWRVTPEPSSSRDQSWTIHLLRCKGMQPAAMGTRRWLVRRDHETGTVDEWQACDVHLALRVVDRPPAPARSRVA